MSEPSIKPSRRFDPWLLCSCVLMFILTFALCYVLTLRPSSDISIHATWAAEGDFRDLSSFLHHGAHPLWHVLVSLLLHLSLPLPVAAAFITALCKVAELWLIHRLYTALMPALSRWQVMTLAVMCTLVSCLRIPWYNPDVYVGVGTPNTWHSCTQLIAMGFMLWCVPYVAQCYDDFQARLPREGDRAMISWRKVILLGVMLFLSLLAKPTFLQVFVPAACLFFLVSWIRHPRNSRFFGQMIAAALPAILFMIVQYMYYFGIIVPSQGDMVLELSFEKLQNVALHTLLIQAFPLYTLLICRKKPMDTLLRLTMVFDAVGVTEFLILGENGRRAADGNFGWGMMGAALMMWVIAIPRFVNAVREDLKAAPKRKPLYMIGTVLLMWHLVSGVYYIIYLFTTTNAL